MASRVWRRGFARARGVRRNLNGGYGRIFTTDFHVAAISARLEVVLPFEAKPSAVRIAALRGIERV